MIVRRRTRAGLWQVSLTADASREGALTEWLAGRFSLPVAGYFEARTGLFAATIYSESLSGAAGKLRAQIRRELKASNFHFPIKVAVKALRRENWAESWKRHFKALEIGRRLLIKPGWSRKRARPGQRVVILDPGLSFGTGHHATTEFCLTQLAALRQAGQGQSLLDIGTGSGILAIAGSKLGYAPVTAFDFDPVAVRVARQNARRNRVSERIRFSQADLRTRPMTPPREWDVVCANLMADLLCDQAEKIVRQVRPGGFLVVAGILKREFRQIRDILVNFRLTLSDRMVNREWQSGVFLRLPIGMRNDQ